MLDKNLKKCYNKYVKKTKEKRKEEKSMKNELTQIKALEMVIAEENGRADDVQAKLVEVYNALVKKKENRKPKAQSEADIALMGTIADVLAGGEKLTVSEIIAKANFDEYVSCSKVTALLKKVEGVQNIKEGKKSLYFIA